VVLVVLVVAWYVAGAGHSSSQAGAASAPATQAGAAPSATPEHGTDAEKPEITIQQSSLSIAEETPRSAGSAPQLTPGRLVRKVDPVYPASARGISGSVVLTALVTKEGKATNVQFVRGPEALASPAIDAVRQWHYEPYRLGGTPVAVQTMIDIKFAPRQKP
jgi:TonB family protein